MAAPTIIRFRRDLTGAAPPPPIWPPGTCGVPFDPARHARAAHALLVQGYTRGGGAVGPFADWWTGLVTDAEYDPALCFVAADSADGTIVGVAQCWTSAFVKDIAVAADRRRAGLGRALVLTAFHAFRARGAPHLDLKVHADNPSGAVAFYQALGMVVVAG